LHQEIFSGKSIGTIFLKGQSCDVLSSPRAAPPPPMLDAAKSARQAGLILQAIGPKSQPRTPNFRLIPLSSSPAGLQAAPSSARTAALAAMADAIESRSRDILAANAQDVEASRRDGLAVQLMQRLLLTEAKVLRASCARSRACVVTPLRLRIW
jgi:hypothetical protein